MRIEACGGARHLSEYIILIRYATLLLRNFFGKLALGEVGRALRGVGAGEVSAHESVELSAVFVLV